jgi:LysM repeat protein
MKLRLMMPKKKLRATAARRVAQPREIDEYDDDEPTMKLSKAFFVVLLLHVIAVGGIYMFNSIKAHRPSVADEIEDKASPAPVLQEEKAPATQAVSNKLTQAPAVASSQSAPVNKATASTVAKAANNPPTEASKEHEHEHEHEEAPVRHVSAVPKDSGAIHVVAKGENPVGIARKFGVGYDDLLKLNNITDPRRLQIGQKLHIPVKTTVKNVVKPKPVSNPSSNTASADTYIGS